MTESFSEYLAAYGWNNLLFLEVVCHLLETASTYNETVASS